ncbi:hypothetical protein SSBR45G_68690 [Bradyrhizobium sp. SSBR45G]|uniref:cobaltochelatase CobT-related protein n=1 Tax=unclassified Bradyrhizobium TaxID=2631580 RepID=UPI002342B527|nr:MULTISPECIES: hypothetical protein [unclassified Bradyrhizobium]GLH81960.1 hypothetical protein SSBR45G_68690 [Bradyrhizobium sp. SSBR45G]GLH89437.1 hypothetical protein SSBR45R_68980 [Bradyrhizobium sp. SSBR45R]
MIGPLVRHLRDVTEQIERTGDIGLTAIGIGHPVGQYYTDGITIDSPAELEEAVVQLIDRLLKQPS